MKIYGGKQSPHLHFFRRPRVAGGESCDPGETEPPRFPGPPPVLLSGADTLNLSRKPGQGLAWVDPLASDERRSVR